jgi:hypothetical protein
MSGSSNTPQLKRAGVFGAIVGLVASAAWFLPRLNSLPFPQGDVDQVLYIAVLLLLPAGTGAIFGAVIAGLGRVFGTAKVVTFLVVVQALASPYAAWRKGRPLTGDVWLDGMLWAAASAAFGIAAVRLARPAGDRVQDVT